MGYEHISSESQNECQMLKQNPWTKYILSFTSSSRSCCNIPQTTPLCFKNVVAADSNTSFFVICGCSCFFARLHLFGFFWKFNGFGMVKSAFLCFLVLLLRHTPVRSESAIFCGLRLFNHHQIQFMHRLKWMLCFEYFLCFFLNLTL